MFTGSLVALATPWKESSLDKNALKKMIEFQISEGTQGIVLCGSTGEGALLTSEEHRTILEIASSLVPKNVSLVANISSIRPSDAIVLAKQAQASGVQGLLITPPPYIRPTQDALYQFFIDIHEQTSLPLILYNNPTRCGIDMSMDLIIKLSKFPRIRGLKDSCGDITRVTSLSSFLPTSFVQLCGEDVLNVPYLAQGGQGWISVTANVAPKLCHQLYQAWQQADLKTFAYIRDLLAPLHKALFTESSPAPLKYALSQLSLCLDEVRAPLLKASDLSKKPVLKAMVHAGILPLQSIEVH